ncbi:MAG: class I SAM-dependent methyltransferase [Bacteroidota bacterium]
MLRMLEDYRGIDIYLLDQMLKGRINSTMRILDAGCGRGRNVRYLLKNNFDVYAIDENLEYIEELLSDFPPYREKIKHARIEEFSIDLSFDIIICNAVLHFARNHVHFDEMFKSLFQLLSKGGILFIRMTSNIGLNYSPLSAGDGVYYLRDDTERYLLTEEKIVEIQRKFGLEKIEPVKSVVVEGMRSMTTWVVMK